MKAARFYKGEKNFKVEDIDIPKIGPNEVLLRVKACGLCHTDLSIIDGILTPKRFPITLGHEIAGEVAEVGEGVKEFQEKDRVIFPFISPCGNCYFCRTGRENICPNAVLYGFYEVDGGHAEYVKVPGHRLVRLPQEVSFEDGAPLACAGGTTFHAIKLSRVRIGETVVVLGVGGLGLYAVQLAKWVGAKVIAVDLIDKKLDLAENLGADIVLNAKKCEVPEEVRNFTGGAGADVILDFAGSSATTEAMIRNLNYGGRFLEIASSLETHFKVNPNDLLRRELQILGIRAYTRQELIDLVELVRQGKVKSTISATFPLTEINTAVNQFRNRRIIGRAVIKP